MLTLEDLKKDGVDRELYAICSNGKQYPAVYVDRYPCVFFCIPSNVTILGFIPRP